MPEVNGTDTPVALKLLYIKLIALVDEEKNKGTPLFTRRLRRSGESFPIYDTAMFYQFTQFSSSPPTDHEWKFTSSRGQVDAIQLYPFDPATSDPDPAKRTIHKSVEGYLRPTPDSLIVVCHYYNGFQKGDGEWAGVRAANDSGQLRLVVDFSSVMTVEDNDLFTERPSAYWAQESKRDPADSTKRLETPIEFEFNDGRVFSVSQKNVKKRDVLLIRYKLNWDSLLTWKAYQHNTLFEAEMII